MPTRLTPEALDALLAEHGCSGNFIAGKMLCDCDGVWPCEEPVYLLASEVRDARARPVIKAAKKELRGKCCKTCDCAEGSGIGCVTGCQCALRFALAHYEEGTK